ncbi:MOS1T transposase, partial [Pseudoatta argentina]
MPTGRNNLLSVRLFCKDEIERRTAQSSGRTVGCWSQKESLRHQEEKIITEQGIFLWQDSFIRMRHSLAAFELALPSRDYAKLPTGNGAVYLRGILLHYFIQKKSAAEAHRILVQTYGDNALSDTNQGHWPLYAQRHDKVILLHDNARPHVAKPVKTYLEALKWEVLPHPLYSPDIAPSDFHLFRSMAHGPADRRFHSYEEAQKWIDSWIASKDMSFFRRGIHVLPERWEKVVESDGKYFH